MSVWYGERPEDRYVSEPNPFPIPTAEIGPSPGISGCAPCGMGDDWKDPFAEPGDDYDGSTPSKVMPEVKINPKTVAAAKAEIEKKKAAEEAKKGSMLPWLVGGAVLFFLLK